MKRYFYGKILILAVCAVLGACAPRTGKVNSSANNMTMRDAMEAYARGDCAGSVQLFSALAASGTPDALNGLGMAQLQCGRPTQAIESFKQAVAIAPASSDLHSNLGIAYFEAGDYRAAGREFDTALRSDPANPEALLGKAGVLLERGEPDKALAVLKQLPPDTRQAPAVLFDRALALYKLGIFDDAESLLRECVARGENGAPVYNALAITLLGRKKYSEGLEFINLAISAEPMDAIYYYNRGNIRRAMKEFPKAIADYGKAIAYSPKFAEAFVNRGDLLYQQHRQKEGCKDLEEACRLGQCERLESFREMGRCLTGIWE